MNLTVYPLTVLWTLLGIMLFPFLFLLWKGITRWEAGRIMRHFVWIYGRVWMVIMAPFVRFRREGFDRMDAKTPCLLVVNHLSFFDTYCMALLPFFDITFGVRSWPFRMLWYGGFMRLAGYLDMESSGWEAIVRAGRKIFAKGGALLVFPEGHRSRDGQLQRFYSGAFRLSVETGVPLVPLCISGTDTLLPPGRRWLQPAVVTLRALDPVDPAEFPGSTGHVQMRKFVKKAMAANLTQMRETGER